MHAPSLARNVSQNLCRYWNCCGGCDERLHSQQRVIWLLEPGISTLNEVAGKPAVLLGLVFPDKMPAVEDVELALRQSSVQAFCIGNRNERIVPTNGKLAGHC